MANWKYGLYQSVWSALDLLFPPYCAGCGKLGSHWCDDCQKKVNILRGTLCDVCGLPLPKVGVCDACRAERPHFRALRGWAVFEDPIRSALHKLKYRKNISLGNPLAVHLTDFLKELGWPIDMIIPIPLGRQRLKERGYNQVGMIAKPLALRLDVHYDPNGLARMKETRSQVGLPRAERRQNVSGAFAVRAAVKAKNVLLMDDVSTTGSTLSSGAEALLSSGAREVYALTVARALPHHGLQIA